MRPQSSYFVFPSIDPTVSLHKNIVIVIYEGDEIRVTIFRNMYIMQLGIVGQIYLHTRQNEWKILS